jgi:ribosomal protein L22
MRTSQASTVAILPPQTGYSRQALKDMVEKPSAEQEAIVEEARRKQQLAQSIFENRANDKNPVNHLKVKVNLLNKYKQAKEATNESVPAQIENLSQNLVRPHVLLIQPRPPKVLVSGIRRKVPATVKKLVPIMKVIAGNHIYDALSAVAGMKTKAARYVRYTLQQVQRHAKDREMDEERLYVHAAITGKHKRWRRMRYHAKGRGHFMLTETSQLCIKLEEKPILEMYKEMIVGKTPPMLAYFLRQKLIETDVDYEVLRRNNFILTAKGRQQRRLMFKRKVRQEQLLFKEKGLNLSRNIIKKKILEEESRVFEKHYRRVKTTETTDSLADRQAIFKKNEEAIGF